MSLQSVEDIEESIASQEGNQLLLSHEGMVGRIHIGQSLPVHQEFGTL